jgi:hypothetical protein
MKKTHKILLLIVFFTIQITVLMAQPGGPGGGPGGGDPPVGGTGVPLDLHEQRPGLKIEGSIRETGVSECF